MQAALVKLTDIAQSLVQDRKKKGSSKLDSALDQVGASSEHSGIGSGKRSAAARRVLRTMFQEQPEEISAMIEKLMWEDVTSQTLTPGLRAPSFSVRAWMEHRSRIGPYRTLAHASWAAAGALDALIQGNVAACRARLGVMMVQFDQAAVDGGNWVLASELGLEPSPPFSALEQHKPPNLSAGEGPYSRILDPRWAELAVAHLREQEDFLSKRKALGKTSTKANQEDDAEAPKRKPKFKPKLKANAAEQST